MTARHSPDFVPAQSTKQQPVKPLRKLFFFMWVICAHASLASPAEEQQIVRARITDLSQALCQNWPRSQALNQVSDVVAVTAETIRRGTRQHIRFQDESRLVIDVIHGAGIETQYLATYSNSAQQEVMLLSIASDCGFRLAKRMHYDERNRQAYLVDLGADLHDSGDPQWLNPALPAVVKRSATTASLHEETSNTRVKVALVDSGVNYLLPEINHRLARDANNELIAYDFWDLDALPFDAHPARSAFFVHRHGTRTASLLLKEAPTIDLVAYRYPRPDMSRMRALIEHADRHGVRIVAMPLGGRSAEQWQVFSETAKQFPHILFIASAGNDGRDLDQEPVYPAALNLANMLVVTSADDFVQPAERTNWGANTVDYMLPAELQAVTDFDGRARLVSGSSYAVSRLAALAANLLSRNPHWQAKEIMAAIAERYAVAVESELVKIGYIPDPLTALHEPPQFDAPKVVTLMSTPATNRLDLDILILHEHWDMTRVKHLLGELFEILATCDVGPGNLSIINVAAPEYLSHLSVGAAHTLLGSQPQENATLVLSDDTRMLEPYEAEAFGLGNTRTRPWLRNSVWLTSTVQHEGNAAAHELFHILANDGKHLVEPGNLMQSQTAIDNVHLSAAQCVQLREVGAQSGLLN